MSEPVYIPQDTRATLHKALARATDAGIHADVAVATVSELGTPEVANRMKQAGNSIRKGQSYSVALNNYGLLTRFDLALLKAGEEAGHISHMHEMLHQRYEARFIRHSRMRAKMQMPVFTTILALFVIPLPQLINSSISMPGYFLRSAGMVLLLIVLWNICIRFYRQFDLRGWPAIITRFLKTVPTFRTWLLNSIRAEILENLAVLLEAGVPVQQAMETCIECASDDYSRRLIDHANHAVLSGSPVAQSLTEAKLLDAREGLAIVSTGEEAGRLPESLKHHALACQTYMDNVWKQISEWIPRVIYAIIALFIIKDIFAKYAAYLGAIFSSSAS